MNEDKYTAYYALYRAIKMMTQVMAPIIPFMTEWIWQALVLRVEPDEEHSVHLTRFPESAGVDEEILSETEVAREVITGALKLRNENNLKIKQPLSALYLAGYEEKVVESYRGTIESEINVKEIKFLSGSEELKRRYLSLDFRKAGPVLKDKVNAVKDLLAGLEPAAMAEAVKRYDEGAEIAVGEYVLPGEIFKVESEYLPATPGSRKASAWWLSRRNLPGTNRRGITASFKAMPSPEKGSGLSCFRPDRAAILTESENMKRVLGAYSAQLGVETLATVRPDIASPRLEKAISIDGMEVIVKMK